MTNVKEYPGYDECEKIDALNVDAFFDLALDPDNPTGIILDTSWGEMRLDLKSIVKNGETITHLELAPESSPTVIRYTNEAGDYECITGDELSRIVSLHLLKDVSQETPPADGDVYVYNGETNLFEPYDLKTTIGDLNTLIGRLRANINNLQNQINAITDIIPFWDTDKEMMLARSNINLISDPTNTNDKTYGIFGHDTSVDQFADEYFS